MQQENQGGGGALIWDTQGNGNQKSYDKLQTHMWFCCHFHSPNVTGRKQGRGQCAKFKNETSTVFIKTYVLVMDIFLMIDK